MKIIRELLKNEFIRGGMFFTISSFVINILNYFFNLLAGRALGPSGYSEITTLFSYVSIAATPIIVFSTFVIQKISLSGKNRYVFAGSLEQLLWLKLKKWWFVVAAMMLFSPLVPKLTNLSTFAGFLLVPFIFLFFIVTFYGAILQGLRLFFLFGILGIFGTLLKLLGAILVFAGIDGTTTIIFCILLSAILPIVISFLQLRAYLRIKITTPIIRIRKSMLSLICNGQFLMILTSTLALTLLNNADIVFVKKFFTPQLAGIYGSWSLFAKIIFYSLGPLIAISFIFFSSNKNKDHKTLNYSLVVLIIVGIASYFFYSNFGSFIINIFFGERFIAVAPYLKQASIFGSLYVAILFINSYYLAKQSSVSLILPILIPIYIVSLFFIKKQIADVMLLNIVFSGIVLSFYLINHLKNILYLDSKSPQ